MGAFLSFSSKDLDQAELLVSLLEFHGVDVWFSDKSIRGGKFATAISEALVRSESLIVLVSQNAVTSKWVASEVSTYLRSRPGAPVVPISIDNTKPSRILKELGEYQTFRFSLKGLEKAFDFLNLSFLKRTPRSDERRKTDRRQNDRRKSPPEVRLRKGLWLTYYRAKEVDKFESISPSPYALIETREILLQEVERYIYRSKETQEDLSAETVLYRACDTVWHRMKERPLGAIFVIEAIAFEISARANITWKERRTGFDRRLKNRRAAGGVG